MAAPFEGLTEWPDVDKHPMWIAGREVGEGSNLRVSPGGIAGGAGVQIGKGFLHQTDLPSPHAPTGSALLQAWSISWEPILDPRSYRHVVSLPHQAQSGLPKLWLPYPRPEAWEIRGDDRTQWTMSATITGNTGARALHVAPVVEVHDRSGVVVATTDDIAEYPGAAQLTLVPGAPGAGEIQVDPDDDVDALVSGDGDLGYGAGHSVHVHAYSMVPVRITNLTHNQPVRNRMDLVLDVVESPDPSRDYEGDV